MKVTIHVDGGSRGNPGPAGAGVVIVNANDQSAIHEAGYFLGKMTNNSAEYEGLIRALKAARALNVQEAAIFSDSELMVKQILGEYRVKSQDLLPLFEQVQMLLLGIAQWKVTHVRREKNQRADQLANMAMDSKDDCVVVDGFKGEVDHVPSASPHSKPATPKPKSDSATTGKKKESDDGSIFKCTIEERDNGPCKHGGPMDDPAAFGPAIPGGFCVYAARAALLATPIDKPDRMKNLRSIEAICGECQCVVRVQVTR